MKIASTLALATLALAATTALARQGVSKTEIVVGTIQDLSGPLAGYGKQDRNGMQLRVDEINEQGGVHGRKRSRLGEDQRPCGNSIETGRIDGGGIHACQTACAARVRHS